MDRLPFPIRFHLWYNSNSCGMQLYHLLDLLIIHPPMLHYLIHLPRVEHFGKGMLPVICFLKTTYNVTSNLVKVVYINRYFVQSFSILLVCLISSWRILSGLLMILENSIFIICYSSKSWMYWMHFFSSLLVIVLFDEWFFLP